MSDDLLVIARDCNHGDSLMSLPTICALAEQHEKVYLAMTNAKVREIAAFPGNVIDVLDAEPEWRSRGMVTQMLGVGAAIGYRFWPAMPHPIHSLMAFAGLEVDRANLPQPQIKLWAEGFGPQHDVLLAPWARATERTLSEQQSLNLAAELLARGIEPAFAGEREQAITDRVTGYWGASFAYIGALMKAAKCVVTADSFPGRLAHAAGVGARHIILDSGATPPQTQTHPGATMILAQRGAANPEWNIGTICDNIERIINGSLPPK
jgi:ADP-heptose:LPS heptosyltransferase